MSDQESLTNAEMYADFTRTGQLSPMYARLLFARLAQLEARDTSLTEENERERARAEEAWAKWEGRMELCQHAAEVVSLSAKLSEAEQRAARYEEAMREVMSWTQGRWPEIHMLLAEALSPIDPGQGTEKE